MLENLRKKMFRLFSWISLKYRLFITYLLLSSLILLLTSVFFYSASKKVLIKCATLSSQQQLSLITNNLGDKINHISDYAITLSINSNIANVLKENPTVPKNELEHFLVNSELTNQTQRIIGLHKNIYAWDILDTENHWFHSSTTETDQLDSLLDSEILDNLRTNLAFQFLGPFQISGEPTFVVLKSITNIDNTKYLGALVLLIKEANISSVFRNLPDSSSRYFYITNEKRQILSSSSSKGIYEDFSSYAGIDPTKYKTLAETGSQIFSINNTDFLFICKSSPALNWKVINLIPLENLTLDHVVILHNILIISIVVFILSVVFSILCTSTVTAPIQRLVDKMKSASAGKLDISVSYSSNDELAVLYNQFNLMMQKIQTLLNDIYEEQNAKQKMEVQLLQSQINPHFLYNTLNTIKSLIELDMKETAVKAVSAMSTFYRNSLSKGQFIIPLRQELILTEQYLYIQNLRYMDFVDYEITYESSWEDHEAEIPKLTIQPVVENIFVHGLTNQMCHIHLNVSIKNNTIYISISDNGSGIPREKLTELNRSIRDFKTARYSFGLPSINHRISLLYGENYGLTIKSSPENGTTVTIAIPDKKSTLGGNIK